MCVFLSEMRFIGNIVAKLDVKNRVFIPAAFRKQLLQNEGKSLFLRKDVFQNCITLYTLDVWEEELQNLRRSLNRWEPEQQELYRQFMLEAEEVFPDASGRILISKQLLQLVGIESEVRFLGIDNMLEIWPKEALEKPRMNPEAFRQGLHDIMTSQHSDTK